MMSTRTNLARLCGIALTVSAVLAFPAAAASFATYHDEAQWQAAAGTSNLETFESYSVGTQVSSLPLLGVAFAEVAGGGFPVIYNHFENDTPYGSHHLANFPQGINEINRYADIVLFPLPGREIFAIGFYNGDGQADTMVATAYGAANDVLGAVGAFKGTFAGMISSAPIAKVVFGGLTGDGWNHIDGLQVAAVPEPSKITLVAAGLLLLFAARRKYRG